MALLGTIDRYKNLKSLGYTYVNQTEQQLQNYQKHITRIYQQTTMVFMS